MDDASQIIKEAERVIQNGGVGKARTYKDLLLYLANRASENNATSPKEIEIAQDVFGKTGTSSPTDSSTRVYIHNLRNKLIAYYSQPKNQSDYQLSIPHGGYSIELSKPSVISQTEQHSERGDNSRLISAWFSFKSTQLFSAFLIGALVAVISLELFSRTDQKTLQSSDNLFWSSLLENEMPILIVSGDTFFYVEDTGVKETTRVIYNLYMDTYAQFTQFIANSQSSSHDVINRYPDSIHFVSRGTLNAVSILTEKYNSPRPIEYKIASEVTANDIRNKNIIFVGQFRTQQNMEPIYRGLPVDFQENYGGFTLTTTDQEFKQIGKASEVHKDYGLFTQHTGENGNRVVTFGSIQDTSLARMVRFATSNDSYSTIGNTQNGWTDLAAVFEVMGFDRSDVEAELIYQTDVVGRQNTEN